MQTNPESAAVEAVAIKRWRATGDYAYPSEECADGEFVDFDDHQSALDALRGEVAENEGVIRVWRRRCEEAERRVEELVRVCAEAYQVVGVLLSDTDQFDTDHGEKILDNLSEARIVHEDVLPWESKEARHG